MTNAKGFSAKEMVQMFAASRMGQNPKAFVGLYGQQRVDQDFHSTQCKCTKHAHDNFGGRVAEAVIFHIMREYIFPKNLFSVRAASPPDDLARKSDVVVTDKDHVYEPLVSDFTTAKDDIFLGKLEMIKKYYLSLFNLDGEEAIQLTQIVQSRGIKKLPENSPELFTVNDSLSLKYYTCPDSPDKKGEPASILIASKLVISIPCNRLFDNFFSSNHEVSQKASVEIGCLAFAQTSAFIEALIRYCSLEKRDTCVSKKIKEVFVLWNSVLKNVLKEEMALATKIITGDSFLQQIMRDYVRDVIKTFNLIRV